MRLPGRIACFTFLTFAFPILAVAEDASGLTAADSKTKSFRRSFAAGLANMGVLVRKGLKNNFSTEFHYLINFDNTDNDELTSHVFGLRGYRHFRAERRLQYFAGVEAAYLLANTRFQSANGYSAGAFAGLEYYLTSRISLGFDLGPYYIWLKEKDFGTAGGGTDFVLNSFLNFYIF